MCQKQNSTKISEFHLVKFLKTGIMWKYRQRRFIWMVQHDRISSTLDSWGRVTLQNSIIHFGSERVNNPELWTELKNVSPKTLLEFWPSINNCFFPREISQKLGTNKGSKRGWWHHVTSVDLLGLRFWWKILLELSWLSDVFDCKKGIMKQMKIVKTVGELSPTTILRICRHLVKKINILHFCKPSYVKLVIFGGKFAWFNEERKVLQDFLRNEISVTCLHILKS